jgi:anti-sigma B factor antagonist
VAQLTIVTEHDDDTVVLRIAGALDLAGGDLIEESARPFVGSASCLVIDLSEVQFIDSSGLGALIALQQQVVDADGELTLRDPSDPVRRVLDVTQTAAVFGVDASPK